MNEPAPQHEYKVQGMTCVNCARGIEKRLVELGATEVAVNFAAESVRFHAADGAEANLVQGVEALGYKLYLSEDEIKTVWWQSIEAKLAFSIVLTLPLLLSMFPLFSALHNPWLHLALSTPVVILGFVHFGKSAISSLKVLTPNMDVLVTTGVAASYFYSIAGLYLGRAHELMYFETSASIVMYILIGNFIEHRAVKKTTSAVSELGSLRPNKARIILPGIGKESIQEVDLHSVSAGDLLYVTEGDRVPTDGTVFKGDALVDESMLTGESLPVEKREKDPVVGGSLVTRGTMRIRATATGSRTVLSEIIQMVSEAQNNKPKIQRIGDTVSAVFVPVVFSIALLTLLVSLFYLDISFTDSLLRSVAVLVVACPCAMGLATPTAVMVGVGRGAKLGILFKGGDTLEGLAQARSIIFDKTGTITTGSFIVREFKSFTGSDAENRSIIRSLEEHSNHPIARSLRAQLHDAPLLELSEIKETRGLAIEARSPSGDTFTFGSRRVLPNVSSDSYFDLYLVKNGQLAAGITIQDELKPETADVVHRLKSMKLYTALLSGDSERKCHAIQAIAPFHEYMSERKPDEKLVEIKRLEEYGGAAYVGDGINDAPALTRASVGIAIGKASAAAMHSARIVLMSEDLEKVPQAVALSRATLRIIKQNLFWAFFYNILMIPLAAHGTLSPGVAALAMAMSDVFVIGNSLRLKLVRISK